MSPQLSQLSYSVLHWTSTIQISSGILTKQATNFYNRFFPVVILIVNFRLCDLLYVALGLYSTVGAMDVLGLQNTTHYA